jgi:regulator of protease activity HflC (stomatin/prohibitin superfamily)
LRRFAIVKIQGKSTLEALRDVPSRTPACFGKVLARADFAHGGKLRRIQSRQGGSDMRDFEFSRDRVVDVGGSAARLVVGVVVGLFLMILLWSAVATVPTGHVGVLTLFGRVTGDVLPEGIHLVNPLKANHIMEVRTQQIKETASVPSSEGLVVGLDTSLIFHLTPSEAAKVYQSIGPDYLERIVEPNLRSAIRSVTAAHSANALYSSAREKVAEQIREELERELSKRGIVVEAVLLRDIQLPATLKQAIEAKQRAEQESLAMSFRLQKEKQEAERKRIEAEGIRDFQRTVAQGINDQLLTWKGIEATEKLAESNNSKVVVIGNPKTGLPIILGQ